MAMFRLQVLEKKNYGVSEQYKIPDECVDKYDPISITADAGDVIFFHMDLFHRSGINATGQIRFAAGVRFHQMLTEDFLPGRLIYKPNETKLQALQQTYESKRCDSPVLCNKAPAKAKVRENPTGAFDARVSKHLEL